MSSEHSSSSLAPTLSRWTSPRATNSYLVVGLLVATAAAILVMVWWAPMALLFRPFQGTPEQRMLAAALAFVVCWAHIAVAEACARMYLICGENCPPLGSFNFRADYFKTSYLPGFSVGASIVGVLCVGPFFALEPSWMKPLGGALLGSQAITQFGWNRVRKL